MKQIEKELIESALREAAREGFTPYQVNDGGDNVPAVSTQQVLEVVDSVDESAIHFRHSNGQRAWLFVVLGNGPDCLADHSVTPGFSDAMDRIYITS
jgi:hypothetical protein